MAALGCDPRGLQPGRAAADDQDTPGVRARLAAAPLELAAGRGVDQAGDPVVAVAAAPAHLVAGEAGPDLLGAAAARLVAEVRVGDLAAHDADHVGLARGEHGLGVLGRAHVALALHAGVPDHLLERGRKGGAELVLVEHGRHQRIEVQVAAGATGDVVDQAALIVISRDLLHGLDRERDLDRGVQVDREADDEALAGALADALDDRGRKAHPVRERAAPAVVPAVRPRGPELIDQGVVGGEQLDPVEARRLGARGGLREAFDDRLDLGLAHGVAAVGIVIGGQARGRPAGAEGVVGIAVLADVVELVDHHHVMRLAGLGDPAEAGDHGVVGGAEVAAGHDRGRMHRHRLDHDHGGPATGPRQVVAEVTLARQAALGHVRGVGAEHEPVLERPGPERQRREQVWEGLRHQRPRGAKPWRRRPAAGRTQGRCPSPARSIPWVTSACRSCRYRCARKEHSRPAPTGQGPQRPA